jgi:hypothetical protein
MKSTCPSSESLHSFLNTSSSDAPDGEVIAHVEHCDSCRRMLDEWSSDEEVRSLHQRRHDSVSDSSPVLQDLINRLSAHMPAEVLDGDMQSRLTRNDWVTFPEPPGPNAPLGKIGRYNVIERIASGGTGLLYKAVDGQLNRTVALKVLRSELAADESYQARLEREARVAASLTHDHIVTLYEIRIEGDFPPCLVMEYVVGESLRERIDRTQVLGPREAARIVREIATALSTAHNQNLVHRDVKPANIMLDVVTGRAKLTDFGLARDEDAATRITLDGVIAGTPAYMSPEQITTPNEVDARSDVYSLGVVLYECLSGRVPFTGVVRMALHQALHNDPQSLSSLNDQVPRDLETICAKAMAKDPSRRYHSAEEFADDLKRFLNNESIKARPVSNIERFGRWCRNNIAISLLSGSLVATLLVIAIGATVLSVELADSAAQYRDISLFALHELVDDGWYPEASQEELESEIEFRLSLIGPHEKAGTEDLILAEAKQQTGELLFALGRKEEAEEMFAESATLIEEKSKEDPQDTHNYHLQVTSYASLARVQADRSQWKSATSFIDKSVKLLDKLDEMQSDDMDFELFLKKAHIHGIWANIYRMQKMTKR